MRHRVCTIVRGRGLHWRHLYALYDPRGRFLVAESERHYGSAIGPMEYRSHGCTAVCHKVLGRDAQDFEKQHMEPEWPNELVWPESLREKRVVLADDWETALGPWEEAE